MSGILVYGPSGSGKSTASESLNHEHTGIICCDMKPLPFRGWKSKYITQFNEEGKPILAESNYVETRKPASVFKTLQVWNNRPEIDVIVWDTMTHVITNRFMTDDLVMGASGWDFYKTLAREIYGILDFIPKMKKDVIVIGHSDVKLDAAGNKIDGVKTIGRLLDEKVDIPSLFTVVLTTRIERDSDGKNHYFFTTQSDGQNFAKSPKGMFEDVKIPNDYNYVLNKIHEYYE